MVTVDVLKRKANELETLAQEVESAGESLIVQARLYEDDGPYVFGPLSDELRALQREAVRKYQRWYSTALELVNEYIPGKSDEFKTAYEHGQESGVFHYLQLTTRWWMTNKQQITEYFLKDFERQRSILLSIPDVAEIKELNLRKIIS